MKVEKFVEGIKSMGIEMYAGIPDSTLRVLCDRLNKEKTIKHYTPADEGAAAALAMGEYLASGRIGCVYMQNSGIGNIINPLTSLAHSEVYGIPILFLIGWRGEPGKKDEPQHKFMGRITEKLLVDLEIGYSILDENTSERDFEVILLLAKKYMADDRQYALLIKTDFFEAEEESHYVNRYSINREEAIRLILESADSRACFITTTGKISREAYEQSEIIFGSHERIFMTVGGMGYASLVAVGIALYQKSRRIYCLDGDGAVLMHMGNMAFSGQLRLENLVHICLNNEAHESVGGMPTGVGSFSYAEMALKAGYQYAARVSTFDELKKELHLINKRRESIFLEICVRISSRKDLGRPRESPEENKDQFIKCLKMY